MSATKKTNAMKKIIFVVMMVLPTIGWSQTKEQGINFTKKIDPITYCLRMRDINKMFLNAELLWCEVYQINSEQKGKIAVWQTTKGETLMLVSEEYAGRKYCITTYFEVDDGMKGIWIGFESRNQYPKLFKKLDRKLRRVYVKQPE